MTHGQEYDITKDLVDEAVKKALDVNSKSGIMFILRERTFREVIEAIIPIITRPLLDRIEELEDQLDGDQSRPQAPQPTATPAEPKKLTDASLIRLRETLEDMVDMTKSEP